MKPVVIAGFARSPFTFATKGELAKVRPDDLLATVVSALVERTGAKPADIEDVIVGCAFPEGEQGMNIARTVSFLAKLPVTASATTVNRYCGSSMQAIHMAAGAIQMGAGELFVCGGIESMSRVPIMGFNPVLHASLAKEWPETYCSMGLTAENVARRYEIGREEQQAVAVTSHAKAAEAQRDISSARDDKYDVVSGLFQIAIVVSSAAIITGVTLLAFTGAGLGLLGVALMAVAHFAPTALF